MRERHTTYPDLWDTDPGSVERSWQTAVSDGRLLVDHLYKHKLSRNFNIPRGQVKTLDEDHSAELKAFHKHEFHGDMGGEFFLTRQGAACDHSQTHIYGSHLDPTFPSIMRHYDYVGAVYPSPPSTWAMPTASGPTDLNAKGASLIAMVKPTNNVANLATDLVEARTQGLPKLIGVSAWKEKTNFARAAGSEYLNKEFGWVPLASDIRDASYAAANVHSIIKSYEQNSGKMVRRRIELPIEMTEVWTGLGASAPYFDRTDSDNTSIVDTTQPQGLILQCDRTYRRTWFSGAFTYHLPLGWGSRFGLVDAAAKAGPLLGIELTPEVVWNAVPWTWALDWVSNIGDCISNTSDMLTDGLVIKYGYTMEHYVRSRTYYYGGAGKYKPVGGIVVSPVTIFIETKSRKKASPFGFGLDWSSFTPRQLAITAALGLTR
jgi:hypothetical protein